MPTHNIRLTLEQDDKQRLLIKQGIAALDRGDCTEVDDEDLDDYLDDLVTLARP